MMRSNLLPFSRLLTPFKRACLFLLLLAGCDTFESDIAAPAVSVSDEELYVLAEAETLIDLESRISANFPGTLSITGQPTHGTLQTIGEGLLRYSPDKGLSRTRDSFEFTVFASNNNVIHYRHDLH
jgi:hypothetical protein